MSIKFLAQLAFDLQEGHRKAFHDHLVRFGFTRSITTISGKFSHLPSNTFCAVLEGKAPPRFLDKLSIT